MDVIDLQHTRDAFKAGSTCCLHPNEDYTNEDLQDYKWHESDHKHRTTKWSKKEQKSKKKNMKWPEKAQQEKVVLDKGKTGTSH